MAECPGLEGVFNGQRAVWRYPGVRGRIQVYAFDSIWIELAT